MTDRPSHPKCDPELVSGSLKAGSFNFTCILLKAVTLKDAEINSSTTDGPLHPNCHPEFVSGSLKAGSFNFTCILLKAVTLNDAEINSV